MLTFSMLMNVWQALKKCLRKRNETHQTNLSEDESYKIKTQNKSIVLPSKYFFGIFRDFSRFFRDFSETPPISTEISYAGFLGFFGIFRDFRDFSAIGAWPWPTQLTWNSKSTVGDCTEKHKGFEPIMIPKLFLLKKSVCASWHANYCHI